MAGAGPAIRPGKPQHSLDHRPRLGDRDRLWPLGHAVMVSCVCRLFAALLFACLLAPPGRPAAAQTPWWQPVEIRGGLAAHDVISSDVERSADLNGELYWQPLLSFSNVASIQPSVGFSANLDGRTSFGFLDLTFELHPTGPLYFDLGGGLALHDGYTHFPPAGHKNLGSRELFHASADLGTKLTPQFGLSVYFDHVSNARLFAKTNQGLETIGLRGAYWF